MSGRAREPASNLVHQGVGRVEVFDFAPKRLASLGETLRAGGRPFSIHAPLFRPPDFSYPPVAVFFLSESPERRARSFALLKSTLAYARQWGAEYVVTHLNWSDDTGDEPRADRLASQAADRLSKLAEEAGVEVHIEPGGYAGAFHRAEQFADLVSGLPNLGLCVDIGHAWLIAQARGRDFYRDLERLAPVARSAHLWNARDLPTYRRHHHVPLHPSQRPEAGWIDVPRTLEILLTRSPSCRLIFEYRQDSVPAGWIAEGVSWVRQLAEGASR